ncbi:magnesium transporter CorA family protein [bacterium]|nr:magnesium transporter CorA family protein [bacterium]
MIEIFVKDPQGVRQIEHIRGNCWVNISAPSREELEKITADFQIPMDFATDALDPDERARIETESGATLIMLRVPERNPKDENIPFITLPVGIILKDDIIITVCAYNNLVKDKFIRTIKTKDFSPANRNKIIVSILQRTALLYLNYLKEINRKTSEIEEQLHESMRNEELIKLLSLEKSLIYFTTSLRSNEIMMERLQRSNILNICSENEDLLEDAIIDNKQAIETANIYSNILSGMMDAFASIISNNLNIVMKFLTSITIILMLPTLVASIYGMNIKLPFQDSPHAFAITMGASLVLTVIGVLIFLKRNWF